MASGILAILDDIGMLLDDVATLSDDVATLSKVAGKKTAGLLGDDLAVNAEKATGFKASRELPVIWAITKGSLINKLIILPVAFLLSAFAPWLIVPILLAGGIYLSYEGVEKVLEWIFPHKKPDIAARDTADSNKIVQRESAKIKSAIRTDFILSIEIIIITLEVVIDQPFRIQIGVVSMIALIATIGVYGVVALLVRMDDTGLHLIERSRTASGTAATILNSSGRALVSLLPHVIRLLGVVGTVAMLLVGGGLFVHNLEGLHQILHALPTPVADLLAGIVVGLTTVLFLMIGRKFWKPKRVPEERRDS